METGARYVVIGLFVLAAIAGGFGFVYWLHNMGGLTELAAYRIRFENTVSGLRVGSAVLFNGMRVGEVTELRFNNENPRQVTATVVVDRNTPIRTDTQAAVEVQGLIGSPSISLKGGLATSPVLTTADGTPPVLIADPAAGQDTMQTAREVLRNIDKILQDNAEPLQSAIGNLNTFSAALARNSDRLDSIAEGLVRMTGGSTKTPPAVYDLTAPHDFPDIKKMPTGQLAVLEPTTVISLDTQKILVRSAQGESPTFDAQWSDTLPKLFQTRIIQSFENSGYVRVAAPLDGFSANKRLLIDIRHFSISVSPAPTAEIEFGAKVLDDDGRIIDARLFRATVPVEAMDARIGTAALNQAFGKAVTELVSWTLGII